MKRRRIIRQLYRWKETHISNRRFVTIMSFIIGILGGLAAVLLKNTVHYIQEILTNELNVDRVNFFYFALPLIGLLLTVLYIKFFVKDSISHGVSKILFAISRKNSVLSSHNTYSSMIGGALTVGFGGSVGLEAPIVLTGSAIGSRLAKFLKMNYKTTTLMLGCGAAAAIAGIFKAPIAALIFALEVLMLDLTMWSIVPLMISAVTGATVSYFLLGRGVMFSFSIVDPFVMKNIPFYIVLGIISGLFSVYVSRGVKQIELYSTKIVNLYQKLIVGGILLGIMIFLFPPLYGEGYTALQALMTGHATDLTHGSIFFGIRNNYWVFILFPDPRPLFQGRCHVGNHRQRRGRGDFCAGAVHGRAHRLHHVAGHQLVQFYRRFRAEFHSRRYGRGHGRGDACAPDGYVSHCGSDRRLCLVHPADHHFSDFLHDGDLF